MNHRALFVGIVLESLMRPFIALGSAAPRRFSGIIGRIEAVTGRLFVAACSRAGLATFLDKHDGETQLLAQMLWQEAERRGIRMREMRLFGLARNLFVADLPDGRQLFFTGIPVPPSGAGRVWWLDNKAVMKRKFEKLGIPVARGGSAYSLAGAKRLFRRLEAPVIVKPHSGSGSRHTTLHVQDERSLARAFSVAKQLSPFAVVEEELVGPVYRATVVDGKCAAVLRRDQPHVFGDGARTVQELVAEANKHPARGGPYFHPIQLDEAAREELSWQDLSFESIPEKGRRVTFHQKVNWATGGTTADVTDETHPDNRELFEEAAAALKTSIVGIDFIISDISHSWKETPRSGIIECNSMPFFDNHHLPFEGKPRNVAAAIWESLGA